eukprot:198172_1
MSQWSRKYTNHTGEINVSKETQRYIKHLQIRSNDDSFYEHNEEDDITHELMQRIEMNTITERQPKEVREARKVIQNWLQIENEAQYIRHYAQTPPKINITKTSNLRRKYISTKNKTKILKQTRSYSSFDAKFAKMKTKALNRQKQQKFESHKKELLSIHNESKIKTKQMIENVFECKDEESIHNNHLYSNTKTNVYNAEQKLRHDLIPSSVYNKINNKNREKLETKKVLLFQLSEIEKQERYHNKKLINKIWLEWKKQINKSHIIEQNAIDLYRKHLLKHAFISWINYVKYSKQIMINVFREWIKIRLISQHNEIKAIEFYEYGLQDNILFIWRDYTKHCIETRKIRAMQLQTRLYKMNKIANRHYKCVVYYKIVKYWKEYVNDEQSKRFLEQQREKRKVKIQKLISSVKQKTINGLPKLKEKKQQTQNIQTQISEKMECKMEEISNYKQINSNETVIYNKKRNNNKEEIKNKKANIHSLKPSKLVISMEKRALERKQKRKQIIELKKQKQKEYKEYMLKQKQIEIEKIKETKRLKKEQKLRKLQKQMYLKEIENNKLILARLHYKKALIVYNGWIPWMKYIERNNLNYHRILIIRNNNMRKQFWKLWQFVINKRRRNKSNAKMAAFIGREKMSNKLFEIKVESKYWLFWKEIILKYKMMNAMIIEKRKLNMIKIYLNIWKKQYELKLNKKRIQEYNNEEIATKHGNLILKKRLMKRWKETAENTRKEKIKARTWRKVELWLTELRANR